MIFSNDPIIRPCISVACSILNPDDAEFFEKDWKEYFSRKEANVSKIKRKIVVDDKKLNLVLWLRSFSK